MVIAEVSVVEHFDSVRSLMAENWSETGFDFPLAPSVELYANAERIGMFFALCAFDPEPIGYSTAFVTPHHFNPAIVVCSSSALFVKKGRRGLVSGRLIRETERTGRARGANRMVWNTRAGTPLAAMLKRRGYSELDTVVGRAL